MSPPSPPATSTPYYTVVGSSADKVFATDIPDDDSWSKYARSYYWSCATASTSASAQKDPKGGSGFRSLGKSLTRKVSSRWRKVGGAVATEAGSRNAGNRSATVPGGEKETEPAAQDSAKGSIQRSGSADTEESPAKSALEAGKERIKNMRSRYSMRISLDHNLKPADMKTPSSPAPSTPTPSTPTSLDRGRLPRRLVKPRPSNSSADPSPSRPSASLSASASAPSSEKASNGKLWSLMKRISTGGLRDKYRSHSPSKPHLSDYSEESLSHTSSSTHGPPPPVPALPKSFQTLLPLSPPRSLASSCSEGGQGPRSADISNSPQRNASRNRVMDKDRSMSSPLPAEPRQKKMMQCIRPISSVGILRRQRSTSTTSNGIAASASASASRLIPIRTTPSGQTRPNIPSRPSTARSSSPISSESTRFFSSSLFGGSRSTRSRRSSISSLDEANGQHIYHFHLPLHKQQHLHPNHHPHQLHHQQQQQQNNGNTNGSNGPVSVPPVPTNILAKHILPPRALMQEDVKTGQNVAQNENGRRRQEKKESISTASLTVQNGSGNTSGDGISPTEVSAGNDGPPYTKGLDTALPPTSATMPVPRPSGAAGYGRTPPSPGRSTSVRGDEWSIAQSPEYELPSLPFPPRKRGASEKPRSDDADDGGRGNGKVPGRCRSSTIAVSPVSTPSPSCDPSISCLREAEEHATPTLSTFGRVFGKQFGMERMENPSSVSVSRSVSSLSSISAGSSLGSRSELSLHGRMSIYGAISAKTRHYLPMSSRIRKSSASAVARSYSLPTSPDMPLPSPAIPLPSQSQPSLPPLKLISQPHSPGPGTLDMLMRKLSFSNGSPFSISSSSFAIPARPARNPRRPSTSPMLRDEGSGREKEQNSNGTGFGELLRKTSVGECHRPMLSNGKACSPCTADHDAECNFDYKNSQNKFSYSLTEREKKEKWQDLLERSDRAGGTIHLNADGEGLLSDRMSARISAASLATTVGTQEREVPQGV